MPQMRQTHQRFFLYIILWFLLFLIVPTWQIKAPGHIPIFFGTCFELPKIHNIWSLGPDISITRILQRMKEQSQFIVKFILFHISTFLKCQIFQSIGNCGPPEIGTYFSKQSKHVLFYWNFFLTTRICSGSILRGYSMPIIFKRILH